MRRLPLPFRSLRNQQSRMEEDLPYPGGECAEDVIRRAEPVLREIVNSGYERVAVVTHAA